jgi:hypothetical protein
MRKRRKKYELEDQKTSAREEEVENRKVFFFATAMTQTRKRIRDVHIPVPPIAGLQ